MFNVYKYIDGAYIWFGACRSEVMAVAFGRLLITSESTGHDIAVVWQPKAVVF